VLGGSRNVLGWIVQGADAATCWAGSCRVLGGIVQRAWLGRAECSRDAVLPCASHVVPRLECSCRLRRSSSSATVILKYRFCRADPATCRESGGSKCWVEPATCWESGGAVCWADCANVLGWIVQGADAWAGSCRVLGGIVQRAWLGRAECSRDAVLPCASHVVPRLECSCRLRRSSSSATVILKDRFAGRIQQRAGSLAVKVLGETCNVLGA